MDRVQKEETSLDGEVSIKLEDGTIIKTVLYNANPNCEHEIDPREYSGINCKKCPGWFCY